MTSDIGVGPVLSRVHRFPGWLFRCGAGPAFRGHLVGVVTTGRVTGKERIAALELVRFDVDSAEFVVMAAYGRRSDWLLNLQHSGTCELFVGRDRFPVTHRELSIDDAAEEFREYEVRRSSWGRLFPYLMRKLVGRPWVSTAETRRELVSDRPLIAFRRATTDTSADPH